MSNIDKRALREAANAANAASWGNWESYKPHKGARGYEVKVGVKAVAQHCLKVDSVFISSANPATVLALLDELEESERLRLKFQEANCELCQKLEAAEKRIADYHELISGLVGVSSSILREVERITNAASAAGKGEAS
ncbi:TPA: ead/Ea22-like family protein [Enterobacter roggenkampii]